MIKIPPSIIDAKARPHLEAVIADIASLYGLEAQDLRHDIKKHLIESGVIKRSTTELDEFSLKEIANDLSSFRLNQKLDELADLNITLILKPFIYARRSSH